jgi:hypothetical protein
MHTKALRIVAAIAAFSVVPHTHAQCSDVPGNPPNDIEGAGFGAAAVMNAAGTVAVVSGPGYDSGDGLVRLFERIGGEWIEGTAESARLLFGDNFGQALAISEDGNTLIVTAPREPVFSPSFMLAAGGAYAFDRNPMTGEWSQVHMWNSPAPGFEYNFGASCDISGDGMTAVIGEANYLGSDFQGLPDAAYVVMRDGSGWGEPVELIPSPAPDNSFNFGQQVKISNDGMLIAVSAPLAPFFSGQSGRVYIFENQGGSWVQTDMLTRNTASSNNIFGDAIGFDGHDLLVCDPLDEDSIGPNGEPGRPICIYKRSGSSYPANPDELMYQPIGSPIAGDFVVRNDKLLVCDSPYNYTQNHGLARYTRNTENPTRTWKFDSIFQSDDPDPFESTGYGAAAGLSDDPSIFVVGEPNWAPLGGFAHGRINFPDRVFTDANFLISPGSSSMFVNFDFPGLSTQSLFVQLLGFFNISYPQNCSGDEFPVQAVIENFSLIPTESEYVLQGPLGMDITLSEVEISLSGASDPSPVAPTGEATFTGMRVKIDAMVQIGFFPAFPFSTEGDQSGPMPAVVTGGSFGIPLGFTIPNLELDFNPDLGLGDNNPTVSAMGNIYTQIDQPVCDADLNNDGELNFFDVSAFIQAYTIFDPVADFTGDGQFNFFDVSAFIVAFNQGCP